MVDNMMINYTMDDVRDNLVTEFDSEISEEDLKNFEEFLKRNFTYESISAKVIELYHLMKNLETE